MNTLTTIETGEFEIKNLQRYQPFLVQYEDAGEAIQVDIDGLGAFDFFDPFSPEIEVEIHTNINNSLKEYGQKTGHNPENIGYFLKFLPSNRLDRQHNVPVMGIKISIYFKKPVQNATSYALTPTIRLIYSIILNEIFILSPRC
ncbi:hypothetical protein FNW52_12430 [Flavobacterium sp. ZT3R18]|uniref:hypothetical protein n=1 Tax=Flavobacterium sp. ZT3R18 TaxID=2594429 RepID=UPI00117B3301|nr:hypothetical protein [Flavobacterium sp. ZT3R18]TRX34942.1 hypothetical protein FNW52_12430 [Flavobacterium sp. ZT3R18]